MVTNPKLRNEVLALYNKIFRPKINQNEEYVSLAILTGILGLYLDKSVAFEIKCAIHKAFLKIKNENVRLYYCKQLLIGKAIKIPGVPVEYAIHGVFLNRETGEIIYL